MRKTIQELLKDKNLKSVTINHEKLKEFLGYPTFKKTSLSEKKEKVGIATGLAWTEVGGDVLEIETTILPGKGGLTLTGQLGDVMQESAHAALSYIRSRAAQLGLKATFNTTKDIHIHIPEGATPKDGPSAGITICAALISGLTNNPIRHDVAMTGEITLQGRVLGVGGLKEKILAGKQHGFKVIVAPQENYDDIQEILKEIEIGDLKLIFVASMDDVLRVAFEKNPLSKEKVRIEKQKTKPKKKTKIIEKKK
jgi:ATP-dependent Lon protease